MVPAPPRHAAVAIVGCRELDESQSFYERLGFSATNVFPDHGYRILEDSAGASIHLTLAPADWVVPDRNAAGIYLYAANVDELAARFDRVAEVKPWGLREFAVSDPNGLLVRVGWPIGE